MTVNKIGGSVRTDGCKSVRSQGHVCLMSAISIAIRIWRDWRDWSAGSTGHKEGAVWCEIMSLVPWTPSFIPSSDDSWRGKTPMRVWLEGGRLNLRVYFCEATGGRGEPWAFVWIHLHTRPFLSCAAKSHSGEFVSRFRGGGGVGGLHVILISCWGPNATYMSVVTLWWDLTGHHVKNFI